MNAFVRLGDRAARFAEAVVPDPFVIALLLTAVSFVVAIGAGLPPLSAASSFTGGMLEPGLLAFGFQMALILLTGNALAEAPPMKRQLHRLADLPRTTGGAAAMVAATAMALALLNWGLGLVAGAFLAREVGRSFARRGLPLNYPLIGAAGYTGLMIWHGGLSGSAPLTVATPSATGEVIPISDTLLSGLNLFVTVGIFVSVTLFFRALGRGANRSDVPLPTPAVGDDEKGPRTGAAGWLERTVLVSAVLIVPVAIALGAALMNKGAGAVNLDWVILLFWILGMVLHRSPSSYLRAFGSGAEDAGGILLQFPIYFGVLAVMRDSGAMDSLATAFIEVALALQPTISAPTSASLGTFFSASVVNLFVPSGGGQWKLQGPLIMESARALQLSPAPLVMAFCYGDQWTNMLQPFWALPLLSITGLSARHLLGYTTLAMLAGFPVILIGLLLF